MKHSSTLFLKAVIFIMGIGVFLGLLRFPQTEGRAANLDLISIYTDPFIIYIYLSSIPFFIGLAQAFKLLRLVDNNTAFSQNGVILLGNIRTASFVLIAFIALAIFYIRLFAYGDDPAGPTALGVAVAFTLGVIATTTTILQKVIKNGIRIKSENELIV